MKRIILNIMAMLIMAIAPAGLSLGTALAACPSSGTAGQQILDGVGETGSTCSSDKVSSTLATAVNLLSYLAGILGVIMVIVSGLRYTTSGGDSGRVSSAKNTLIYAMVGLAIAALAQIIVQFVLSTAAKA